MKGAARGLVVVTGAAGGIGSACVRTMVEAGYPVLALDAAPIVGDIASVEGVECVQGDVSDPVIWQDIAVIAARGGSGCAAFVHAAAIQPTGRPEAFDAAIWYRTMDVNLHPLWQGGVALKASLCQAQGVIIAITSVHATATSANIAPYAASKGALAALVRALAIDWGADGIRVVAVAPGAVDTPMLDAGLQRGTEMLTRAEADAVVAARRKALAGRAAIGRVAAPNAIAEAVAFLADPLRAGMITGIELVVDGGVLCRLATE